MNIWLVWCTWTTNWKVSWYSEVSLIYTFHLFIVKICHDVQKEIVSTLNSMSCQTFTVYTEIIDLVDLCPNIWCNNLKDTFFQEFDFLILTFPSFFLKPKMHVFAVRCAVISPCYVHYHWRKPCKNLYGKYRYVSNQLI